MSLSARAAPRDRLAFEGGILPAQRRVALVLNKSAILDALDADRVSALSASFEALPFGCYLENVEVLGPTGTRALPGIQIRYARPGRRSRFRHRKICIRGALAAMLEDILGDAWDSVTALDGTVRIDVAGRALTVSGRSATCRFQRVY